MGKLLHWQKAAGVEARAAFMPFRLDRQLTGGWPRSNAGGTDRTSDSGSARPEISKPGETVQPQDGYPRHWQRVDRVQFP
ncbi:hypothetical protein GCM10023323_23540 [Streptomyces thinghirensis]|uniref:Uncharacterized protein n=1 Tax=Streptomyces thinghirensis TaxID=551547 RepID=A0ABP9T2R5_9ACTN